MKKNSITKLAYSSIEDLNVKNKENIKSETKDWIQISKVPFI